MNKRLLKLLTLIVWSCCVKAQVPGATVTVPTGTFCSGQTYSFNSILTNTPTSLTWLVIPSANGTMAVSSSSTSINYTFGNAGVHFVRLIASNASGSVVATRTIVVNQSAEAAFNASLITQGYPNQLQLTNFSNNSIKNYWVYSDVAPKDSNVNTVKSYTTSGSYQVNLIALGVNGCNDTTTYRFRISDSSGVILPTIFSPNNDGVNDIFKPIIAGLTNMKLDIYNRYGTIIFSSDRINAFWDGRTTSGEPCSAGVYFYTIEAKGFDGKVYSLKRTLTLVR
jgi:gliding motility-associated-like protein